MHHRYALPSLIAFTLLIASAGDAGIVDGPWPAPNDAEAAAIARGRDLGVGTVVLLESGPATVRTYQTWTLRYTAGKAGVARGGSVLIGMRHMQHLACPPQVTQTDAAGYVTVSAPPSAGMVVDVPTDRVPQFFAWQQVVRATVHDAPLAPGDTVDIVLGDRSGGGPGMLTQPFDETRYGFKVYADVTGAGEYLPLPGTPVVEIIAGETALLNVVMPSDAVVGQPAWCIVRAEDAYGNPAPEYRGTVQLNSTESEETYARTIAFGEADRGVIRVEDVVFHTAGTHSITADDGTLKARGNPVRVQTEAPAALLLWGDLHGHTLYSDGRGTVEEFYDFAERVAGLDFCAVTDHAFEVRTEMWTHSKEVTNRAYRPGRFVTFNAFEWSGATPLGGDHNVFFPDDDPPIFRSEFMYDPRNLQMVHDEPTYPHINDVFAEMLRRLKDKNVFCIPHYGGRKGNPDFHDPQVQRMIEIFSEHQRSEAWANTFLSRGYRLGIVASTDGHYGNPGYGYLKYPPDEASLAGQEIGMASVAVYASARTREAVFESLYDRRVYATSGDRIILDMNADGHPMGSEFISNTAPTIRVYITGTAPVTAVEFKKDGVIQHVVHPDRDVVQGLTWQDPDFDPAKTACYYVRVLQGNGEEAITSPVWLN